VLRLASILQGNRLTGTAIINGLLAPFLLVGILIAASDRKLMWGQPSSWLSRIVVGVTIVVMFGAAIAMFLLYGRSLVSSVSIGSLAADGQYQRSFHEAIIIISVLSLRECKFRGL
jgi:hypothetical protein